jgi:hypothetical protein
VSDAAQQGVDEAMAKIEDLLNHAIRNVMDSDKMMKSHERELEISRRAHEVWEAKVKVFRRALEAAQQLSLLDKLREGDLEG